MLKKFGWVIPFVSLLSAGSLGGCFGKDMASEAKPEPTGVHKVTQATPLEPLSQTKFGQPISGAAVALTDIASDPSKFAGQTVKTEGVVTAVCQAAGCWMEIGDDTKQAHIKMANHSFFVPKKASGHRAIVQGTISAGPPKDECSQKDRCGGEENGAIARVEIVATGVEFID
jgi:hypothetical protein